MQSSRRQFFKHMMGFVGTLSLLQFAQKAAADECATLPLVVPGKDMAASVNYQNKKSEIKDAKLKADRQGVKWDAQNCSNCMLYTACSGGFGKCAIFAGKKVSDKAWCTTWAKKG